MSGDYATIKVLFYGVNEVFLPLKWKLNGKLKFRGNQSILKVFCNTQS